MTSLNLTDEMHQALAARPSGPIPIEDDQEYYCRLQDDYYRRELQIAFNQIDRGKVSDLDMNALLAEAHRRHAARL